MFNQSGCSYETLLLKEMHVLWGESQGSFWTGWEVLGVLAQQNTHLVPGLRGPRRGSGRSRRESIYNYDVKTSWRALVGCVAAGEEMQLQSCPAGWRKGFAFESLLEQGHGGGEGLSSSSCRK